MRDDSHKRFSFLQSTPNFYWHSILGKSHAIKNQIKWHFIEIDSAGSTTSISILGEKCLRFPAYIYTFLLLVF